MSAPLLGGSEGHKPILFGQCENCKNLQRQLNDQRADFQRQLDDQRASITASIRASLRAEFQLQLDNQQRFITRQAQINLEQQLDPQRANLLRQHQQDSVELRRRNWELQSEIDRQNALAQFRAERIGVQFGNDWREQNRGGGNEGNGGYRNGGNRGNGNGENRFNPY